MPRTMKMMIREDCWDRLQEGILFICYLWIERTAVNFNKSIGLFWCCCCFIFLRLHVSRTLWIDRFAFSFVISFALFRKIFVLVYSRTDIIWPFRKIWCDSDGNPTTNPHQNGPCYLTFQVPGTLLSKRRESEMAVEKKEDDEIWNRSLLPRESFRFFALRYVGLLRLANLLEVRSILCYPVYWYIHPHLIP